MIGRSLKILVLADDLTGAAEIGGIALQYGLAVRILTGGHHDASIRENVAIIDTASRGFEPEKAHQAIRKLLAELDLTGYDLVYMKVDSVLRGPVIAGIRSLLEEPGFDRALLIPANPSRNRIIRDGHYFIDGVPINQTAFRLDPLHPRLAAEIPELVENDGTVVTGSDPMLLAEGKVFIPDTGSVEDIERWISDHYRPGILLAGGSDHFRAALKVILHLMPARDPVLLKRPLNHHFISGSRSESSIRFVNCLVKLGYHAFKLPAAAIRNESLFMAWTIQIGVSVKSGEKVVVSGPPDTETDPLDAGGIAGRVALAAKVVAGLSAPGTQLFIEGGETASSFFREMGWYRLIVKQFHDVGVVTLQPEDSDRAVTVKPGSYPWPRGLLVFNENNEKAPFTS